jgi:hypothetical protein
MKTGAVNLDFGQDTATKRRSLSKNKQATHGGQNTSPHQVLKMGCLVCGMFGRVLIAVPQK